ncbi:hypothetical protein B0A48_08605 [Cryoendolithus antarcticus]|uniref:Uncharacterized protein n=1 Tax=Cryoendolithus antarcticus TaxID=1507870 RepID=A0A1V8T3M5_9PEZI|nr:hypothetical protein B0A48_08605 [Cryoendolithus antarcticus]
MATYGSSPYSPQPPPLGARQSSNADKYRPRAYSNPPPTQPNPTLLGPQQVPYPSPQMPARSSQEGYGFPEYQQPHVVGQPMESRLEPHYPGVPNYGPPRDRDYERRPSHSSQRSRHSHHSQVSHHSRHSHDDRRSGESRRSHQSQHSHHSHAEDERVRDDNRERRHSHQSSHEHESESERRRRKQKKASKETRPTYGDSIFAAWDFVKSALGPRDKY